MFRMFSAIREGGWGHIANHPREWQRVGCVVCWIIS